MARGRGTMKIINPGNRTNRAELSRPSDWFTPDWDKDAGAMQHRRKIEERAAMGQKKTPVGRTTIGKNGC